MSKLHLRLQAPPDANGCVRWVGPTANGGYGAVQWRGRSMNAHRAAYEIYHQCEVPKGVVVRHTCDNPWCVAKDHLVLGTARDNVMDAIERGRFRSGHMPGEKNGRALLSEADVLLIRASKKSNPELAAAFGVSIATISHARLGRNWKHLPTPSREKRMSLNDRLDQFFLDNVGVPVDGKDLAGIAGSYAWRTRVSNVRQRFKRRGGNIINDMKHVRVGDRTFTISTYRAVLP